MAMSVSAAVASRGAAPHAYQYRDRCSDRRRPVGRQCRGRVLEVHARNFALLERYAGTDRAARPGDWLFVAAVMSAVALLPVIAAVWIFRTVARW
jgi:hypothetical protein